MEPKNLTPEDFAVDAVCAVGADVLTSKRKGYDLHVTDEEIRTRGVWPNKTVRRGRIRYFREIDGNILREAGFFVSESGPLTTRFLGYVWVPARLPEYALLKAKVESWAPIE